MPRHRIPLTFTNKKKLKFVEDFHTSGLTRSDFCRSTGVKLETQRTRERKVDKLVAACAEKRANKLAVGGSGRRSESRCIEDALVMWVKDQRREELPVSRESIVRQCIRLLPGFLQGKSEQARLAWCDRFMKRSGLTIRRISHSGRKKKDELMQLREAFAVEVTTILMTHFLDSEKGVPLAYVLYNMDQTSVYCQLGARSTADFVGVKRVPWSLAGKGGYRCTVALTACADGRLLPPHFVFKGKEDGNVEKEVAQYCGGENATCAVQTNAWFDERVMLDWIEQVWQFEVTGPSVLILDSLKAHLSVRARDALAGMGTSTVYVPGGAASVCQSLDVGVMGPFKTRLRKLYVEMYTVVSPPLSAYERRRNMIVRTLTAMGEISAETVRASFVAAGPFIPFGSMGQGVILEAVV